MARCYRQVTPLGSEARGRGRGGACYRQLTPLGSEGRAVAGEGSAGCGFEPHLQSGLSFTGGGEELKCDCYLE